VQRSVVPSQRGSFIGRGEERRQLEKFLGAGERLISIVGPSGMGKTSLAKEVARTIGKVLPFEDGVWFCDLMTTTTRVDLVAHVAHVLGLSEGGRRIDEAELFRGLKRRDGAFLLVLDNSQGLEREAALLVGQWVDEIPALRVLATSLVPLQLQGELLFELGPLDLDAAVKLYLERARANRSGRSFSAAETRLVTGLVQHLDRYPLAIELAAARAKTLPPRTILERIDERFSLLEAEGLGQHRSLEWALQSSWDLLDLDERRALAWASVFQGGITLEAAEAVMGPSPGRKVRPVVDVLESLREKALLQLGNEAEPRFTLYESIQAFASKKLDELEDREEAEARHASHFLRYVRSWLPQVDGPQGHHAIAGFAAERGNLLVVFDRLVKTSPKDAATASLAVCYVAARVGVPVAEMDLLARTIAAARRADAPLLLVHALRCRLSLNRRSEDAASIRADLDEAITFAHAAGELSLAGQMWNNHAMSYLLEGKAAAAKAALAQAKEIEAGLDDPMLIGTNRMSEGTLAIHRGDPQEALEQFRASLAAFRRCGNLHFQARALLRIGGALVALGTPNEARDHLSEALRIYRQLSDPGSEADTRLALGCIVREEGQLDEAEEHLAAALPFHQHLGNHRFEGQTLWNLGLIAMEKGELSLAESRLREAHAIFEAAKDELNLARLIPNLAVIEAFHGRVDEATSKLQAAREHLQAAGSPSDLEILDLLEGFVDLARARRAAQESRFDEAAAFKKRATRRLSRSVDMGNGSLQAGSQKRILTTTIERYVGMDTESPEGGPPGEGSAKKEGRSLLIGPEAAWFEMPGRPRVQLRTRSAGRRILQALVESRLLTPGRGLSVETIFQIGWPRTETHPYEAAKRVYDGVGRLRRIGLGEILARNAEGYLLSPEVEIQRVSR